MTNPLETRILLRTATSRDATMAAAVLERAGIAAARCAVHEELAGELGRGAGALLLSEEVLKNPGDAASLAGLLAAQPPWSDLPVLVLARQGADSPIVSRAMEQLLNVTVIERPVRVAALVSALRSALRARRRQYELRELFESLRLADQRKTEFLATLAHELRNPLAPLLTALALMRRKNGAMEPEQREHYFDLMGRQIDHMRRLVDDLMEVSRITRGRIELHMQTVALESVLKDAIEQSRPLVRGAGHALSVQLPGPDLVVRGDPLRLTQVFVNLLNNAAKYTLPGGRLRVAARADEEGMAVVEVSDSGVGIAPDMLESVFEMFVQVSGTARAAQGGLGIGLTLVKSLVGLHGGSIQALSEGLGRGTTMAVRLPLLGRPAVPPPVVQRNSASAADVATAPLAGRALLVVDDNRDAADTLAELLAALGARVAVAYNGEEALRTQDAAGTAAADAAILDLGMPGMDGYELARRLRERPGGGALRLIAMTGWGQPSDRERVKAAGFDHHLLKPMDLDALIALL